MAKRKLTSLRSVLLRYLLLCGGGCALILVLWWVIFMQLINIGFLLPAVASAQACADARETVASMTADTFDSLQISDLCRWAVVQNDTVLQTNMNDRHLKIALNAFHGGSGNLGYTQYQYDVKMADGSFCLLQYDYATPYADPALRDTLPDFQTCYIVLLAALILVWLGWQTHCTVRAFAAETARLNAAVDAIAARQLEQIDTEGVRIREFAATLQALQTMGRELTDSLQSQWRMEQQRTEQTNQAQREKHAVSDRHARRRGDALEQEREIETLVVKSYCEIVHETRSIAMSSGYPVVIAENIVIIGIFVEHVTQFRTFVFLEGIYLLPVCIQWSIVDK